MNRTEFLTYLKNLPPGNHLSGQHLDESDPQGSYNRLVSPLPDVPAILGASPRVGASDDQSPNKTLFSILADHATKGGVVMLECHFANPFLPTSQQSIGSAWLSDPHPDLTQLSPPTGVSPAYLAFWAQVDRFIDLIKTLPDNTLLILRLLHEANGEWFWWGYDPRIADQNARQVALYTQLQKYITPKIKQNPLWMHSGSGMSYYAPCDYGRPDWVDLVGASLYRDQLDWIHQEDLDSMRATGKPMFLSEAGPDVSKKQSGNWDTTQLYSKVPLSIVGWQTWQGYTDPTNGYLHLAAVENLNWQNLYIHPSTITRSGLPKSVTPPPTPPTPAPFPPVPAPANPSHYPYSARFPRFYRRDVA